MGLKKVFSVFDTKAGAYGQPWFMDTTGMAIRSFIDAANDEKSQLHRHADDFVLFELAEYDEVSGQFLNLDAPISHGTALKYISEVGKASVSNIR